MSCAEDGGIYNSTVDVCNGYKYINRYSRCKVYLAAGRIGWAVRATLLCQSSSHRSFFLSSFFLSGCRHGTHSGPERRIVGRTANVFFMLCVITCVAKEDTYFSKSRGGLMYEQKKKTDCATYLKKSSHRWVVHRASVGKSRLHQDLRWGNESYFSHCHSAHHRPQQGTRVSVIYYRYKNQVLPHFFIKLLNTWYYYDNCYEHETHQQNTSSAGVLDYQGNELSSTSTSPRHLFACDLKFRPRWFHAQFFVSRVNANWQGREHSSPCPTGEQKLPPV